MKLNAMATLNQRVDRVTVRTLVVGVDIAKDRHVAQTADFRGRILNRRPIRFNNSQSGFEHLLHTIKQLQRQHHMNDFIVGMESTGHYFSNLANWLVDRGIQVVLVNPATTKRNKENRDNTPSKSDPKDAEIIADLIGRGYYTPYDRKDPLFQRLNFLAKVRDRIDRDLTRIKNRIHGWLDTYFPEYLTVFKDPFVPRSLATLHQCPTPGELQGLSVEEVIDRWAKQGMRRPSGTRGMKKAAELLQAANRSIGSKDALDEAKWALERLLEDYERTYQARQEVEEKMRALLPEAPATDVLQTIGLPPVLCASILAFAGDLSKLNHGNQLLRMAGFNLAEKSSGKYKGQIKLSKRGNSRLRKQLYLAVIHLLKHNASFRTWHKYNVETKGMMKMQSVMKLIRKLARILVAMARKNEIFKVETATSEAA